MKPLSVSIQDFKVIRDDDFYYVDKSRLISGIIRYGVCGTFLYTRPRRFGKSLNLSMIDAYLNTAYADRSDSWFEGLAIRDDPMYPVYRGRYPVLFMDFKDMNAVDRKGLDTWLNNKIDSLYSRYRFVLDSDRLDDDDKSMFREFKASRYGSHDAPYAVYKLAEFIHMYYDSDVVVIIDEYDSVMNNAYGTVIEDDARRMMRDILGPLLKGCGFVRASILAGVAQISKESLFSGVNNLVVDNILSENNGEMFGFTDDEVSRICSDFGHPEKIWEARAWYDGYRFGGSDVYNPWSVLRYVGEGFTPGSYWAMTSGNSIIDTLLHDADERAYRDLAALESGGSITSDVDTAVIYGDLKKDRSTVYSLMAVTGYLNAVIDSDGAYSLSIPNREVREIFASKVLAHLGLSHMGNEFLRYALNGDVCGMKEDLGTTMDNLVSVRNDWSPYIYQAVVTLMLGLPRSLFSVYADRESGDGFCDIRVVNPDPEGPHAVIEVKSTKDEEMDLESLARKGLEQIHDRRYCAGMDGNVMMYGIAFCGKRFSIVSQCSRTRHRTDTAYRYQLNAWLICS